MKIEKEVLQAAVESLTIRAEDCFERAQDQQSIAASQRASAAKLVVLGEKLEADAINLAGEIEMATGQNSPTMNVVANLPVKQVA